MTYDTQLVAFANAKHAELLVNYLQQQGIQAIYRVGQGEYRHKVCVLNAAQLEQANQLTKAYLENPKHPKYQAAAWAKGKVAEHTVPLNFSTKALLGSVLSAPFCGLVLFVCILVFVLDYFSVTHQVFASIRFQSIPRMAVTAEWWRLITPALYHFSTLHIVFNLLWWWSLGKEVEKKLGSSTLVIIFVTSALLSNYLQFLQTGNNFGGLSGVVYALLGFVWWLGWLRPNWGLGLPKSIVGFMLIWLVLGYADVLWINMANTAHTVGLVVGCLLAWTFVKLSNRST